MSHSQWTTGSTRCENSLWLCSFYKHSASEPSDFLGIYKKKAISAWGSYPYKAFSGATDKMTKSPHWRHFRGNVQCSHTCHSGSSEHISAHHIAGPSVDWGPWVRRDGSCLSGPQQMCWGEAVAHVHQHLPNIYRL